VELIGTSLRPNPPTLLHTPGELLFLHSRCPEAEKKRPPLGVSHAPSCVLLHNYIYSSDMVCSSTFDLLPLYPHSVCLWWKTIMMEDVVTKRLASSFGLLLYCSSLACRRDTGPQQQTTQHRLSREKSQGIATLW